MCVCLCVGSRVVWMIMIQMSNNAVLFSVWLRIFSTSQGDGLTLPCPFIYINQTPAEVMIYLSLHLHLIPFPRATFSLQSGEWSLSQGTVFPEILDGRICIIVSHHPDILFVLQVVTSPFCCVVTYFKDTQYTGSDCGMCATSFLLIPYLSILILNIFAF